MGLATENGLVSGGSEYTLDVLVLSTGLVFQDKWRARGATTLHGILSHDFPSLFFLTPLQAGSSPNNVHMLDVQARHIGYILGQARGVGGERGDVEPQVPVRGGVVCGCPDVYARVHDERGRGLWQAAGT